MVFFARCLATHTYRCTESKKAACLLDPLLQARQMNWTYISWVNILNTLDGKGMKTILTSMLCTKSMHNIGNNKNDSMWVGRIGNFLLLPHQAYF